MALVHTPQTDSSFHCPDFQLPGVDGQTYSLEKFKDKKALLIMFLCNHCPYVKAIEDRLIQLGTDFSNASLGILAICSNNAEEYPEDSFENIQKKWQEKNYSFPYAYDESQKAAQNFGAVCTPDFFLFGPDRKLFYRGRLDDSWKDPNQVSQQDMKMAIEQLLKGEDLNFTPTHSMGCSIKWKDQ